MEKERIQSKNGKKQEWTNVKLTKREKKRKKEKRMQEKKEYLRFNYKMSN